MYDFIYMKFQKRQNSTGGSKQNSDCPQSRRNKEVDFRWVGIVFWSDGVLYIWWLHKKCICENSNHIHKMDRMSERKTKLQGVF